MLKQLSLKVKVYDGSLGLSRVGITVRWLPGNEGWSTDCLTRHNNDRYKNISTIVVLKTVRAIYHPRCLLFASTTIYQQFD